MGEIDYRHPHWGHSLTMWKAHEARSSRFRRLKQTAEFSGWCTPVPSVGDTVLIEMKGDPEPYVTRWEFTKVEAYGNPSDMYHAHVKLVGVVADPPRHTPATVFGTGYRDDEREELI